MRSCVCSDYLRLLHFPLFAVHLLSLIILSFFLPVKFIFQDVVDKFPVHLLMRTLAPLPSATLSHINQEETGEAQENRIEYFKKNGDQHLPMDGRNAEIERDDQAVAHGEDLYNYEVLSRTFHGSDGGSKVVEDL